MKMNEALRKIETAIAEARANGNGALAALLTDRLDTIRRLRKEANDDLTHAAALDVETQILVERGELAKSQEEEPPL
jgi:hypothetical protein